jgi:hypothetical protein
MNTTRFGYVIDGRKRRLKTVDVEMHVVNDGDILIACNIIYKIYRTMMKMFLTMLLSNLQ